MCVGKGDVNLPSERFMQTAGTYFFSLLEYNLELNSLSRKCGTEHEV